MDTIFELFTALNAAIDAGVMTQEILTVAVMNIAHRTAVAWKAGNLPAPQLRRVSEEMQHLDQHWKACTWAALVAPSSPARRDP